jgi:hypothetical protein
VGAVTVLPVSSLLMCKGPWLGYMINLAFHGKKKKEGE